MEPTSIVIIRHYDDDVTDERSSSEESEEGAGAYKMALVAVSCATLGFVVVIALALSVRNSNGKFSKPLL